MKKKQFNKYIALGTIAIVDISTPLYPEASMKIDLSVWLDLLDRGLGRVCCNGVGYAQGKIGGKVNRIHKMITQHFNGHVDHENHDRLDNRFSNLRDVTPSENQRNRSIGSLNKSGHIGINEVKGVRGSTWRTTIWDGKKKVHLGVFKTIDKAIVARKAAEVELGFHKNHGAK